MAILKIYSDIVDEQEKTFYEAFGMNAVSYQGINDFIDSMPSDDDKIDLKLHCNGGDCIEGWAIYDALRQSGKEITATIDGKCASMATVILLSAPKERRFATKNARLCIHNPFIMGIDGANEPMTADKLADYSSKIQAQEQALREEQNKIINLYVERTGADRETLQALMNEDKYIDMIKAKELGFIQDVLEPNTAYSHSQNNNMNKNVTIKAGILDRMLAKLGIKDINEFKVVDMVLTSVTGDDVTIEREDGEPQVGDVAKPDGTFVLEDGTSIVVADGVIAEIVPPTTEEEATEQVAEDTNDEVNDEANEETTEETDEPEKEDEESVEELKQKIAELEAKLAEAESKKKEDEEKCKDAVEIANIVNKAGGMDWLKEVTAMRSTYNAHNRKFVEHTFAEEDNSVVDYASMKDNLKAEADAKRKKFGLK